MDVKSLNKLVHVVLGSAAPKHDWSYEGECGPQTWQRNSEAPRGPHQWPSNIEPHLARSDKAFAHRPLAIDYDHPSCAQTKNTGYTFQLDGPTTNMRSKCQLSMNQP